MRSDLAVKWLSLISIKSEQVSKICSNVKRLSHPMHIGGSSPFNKKEWVRKEWPMCNRAITVSLLGENNLKIISTRLPEKWQMLVLCSGNTSLALNCQKFSAETTQSSIQKPTMWQWEVARLTHAPLKTQDWAYSGLENKQTAKYVYKIFMTIFSPLLCCIFVRWKFWRTKYTQIVRVNRSAEHTAMAGQNGQCLHKSAGTPLHQLSNTSFSSHSDLISHHRFPLTFAFVLATHDTVIQLLNSAQSLLHANHRAVRQKEAGASNPVQVGPRRHRHVYVVETLVDLLPPRLACTQKVTPQGWVLGTSKN